MLQAVIGRNDADHDTLLETIRATTGMGDSETSRVLQAAATTDTLTGDLRDAYVDAASTLGDFEQGPALTALVRHEHRK